MHDTEQISVRFKKTQKELLLKICEERGEDLSSFVRRAVFDKLAKLSYLSESQKKALGID